MVTCTIALENAASQYPMAEARGDTCSLHGSEEARFGHSSDILFKDTPPHKVQLPFTRPQPLDTSQYAKGW